MTRNVMELIKSLPNERQEIIDKEYQLLSREVESLNELRKLTTLTQEQVAENLNIKQPSVHKIEKQTDLYISTLRRFISAVGGELEITVKLPDRSPIHLDFLGNN